MTHDVTRDELERRAQDAGRVAGQTLDDAATEYWAQMDPYQRLQGGEHGVPIPTDQEKVEGAGRFGTLSEGALRAALEAGHAESELDAITGR
jgi:hypothetical protein